MYDMLNVGNEDDEEDLYFSDEFDQLGYNSTKLI